MRKQIFTLGALLYNTINFSSAQITFQKTYGGVGHDESFSVQQTSDSGFIMVGVSYSIESNGDVYLIKTNANGDILWTKTYGGAIHDGGHCVRQTNDGGFIIVGQTGSFGVGNVDIFLLKTDSIGNLLWVRTFDGMVYGLTLNWVQQTNDQGYIIVSSNYVYSSGNADIYLIKTNSLGDTLWTKSYGGSGQEYGNAGQQTIDGGYIVTGYTTTFGSGGKDIYLVKTDSTGSVLWSKTFGGTGDDYAKSIIQTVDGGYILLGSTNSFGAGNYDYYLIKTNSTGDLQWSYTYGGISFDYGFSVSSVGNNGFIMAGYSNVPVINDEKILLIRTNFWGDTLWTKTFGYGNFSNAFAVQQTFDGGYVISGRVSFSPTFNAYLIKTNSIGFSGCNEVNHIVAQAIPLTIVTNPLTAVLSGGNITVPVPLIYSVDSSTTLCSSVGINEIVLDNSFIISPNPSSGNFIISLEGTIMKGNVKILNILGETILSENIFNESKKEIILKNISGGIYFVKVFDGEKYYCKKIIIEQD